MMAGVVLRPVDGGQDIELPLGKTTVGRGPLFGVSSVHEVCVHHKLSRSEVRSQLVMSIIIHNIIIPSLFC